MATFTGSVAYTIQAPPPPASTSTFTGTVGYTIQAPPPPVTTTTFTGTVGYTIQPTKYYLYVRDGSGSKPARLGMFKDGQIIWLSPPLPATGGTYSDTYGDVY